MRFGPDQPTIDSMHNARDSRLVVERRKREAITQTRRRNRIGRFVGNLMDAEYAVLLDGDLPLSSLDQEAGWVDIHSDGQSGLTLQSRLVKWQFKYHGGLFFNHGCKLVTRYTDDGGNHTHDHAVVEYNRTYDSRRRKEELGINPGLGLAGGSVSLLDQPSLRKPIDLTFVRQINEIERDLVNPLSQATA